MRGCLLAVGARRARGSILARAFMKFSILTDSTTFRVGTHFDHPRDRVLDRLTTLISENASVFPRSIVLKRYEPFVCEPQWRKYQPWAQVLLL